MTDFVVVATEEQLDALIKQWLMEIISMHTDNMPTHPEDVRESRKLVKSATRLYNYISIPSEHI